MSDYTFETVEEMRTADYIKAGDTVTVTHPVLWRGESSKYVVQRSDTTAEEVAK